MRVRWTRYGVEHTLEWTVNWGRLGSLCSDVALAFAIVAGLAWYMGYI